VPILPTCTFYIFVAFNQYSLVGQVFLQIFCANLFQNTC
jgi:hypothetical protein